MKSDRKRMQKEEEMEKQTKINAGAVKPPNAWMSKWRFLQRTLLTVGEFTAMESTQRKQKKNHVKSATR